MATKRLSLLSDREYRFTDGDDKENVIKELNSQPRLFSSDTNWDVDNTPVAPSSNRLSLSGAGNFMSQPGMANAIGQGGQMVGSAVDPEGSGMGPAISGAASGAAIGTTVFPGIGTAVGAAIGLGLGLISAKKKREAIKNQAEAKGKMIMGEGIARAGEAVKQGMVKQRMENTRRLKL